MTHPTSISELTEAVASGSETVTAIVQRTLERIEAVDPPLASFRETYPDHALAEAARLDRLIEAGGVPGPLAGTPIAIKDNLATSFGRTSCGSRMLEDYRSPFTATAVQRLVDAGAVVVGKTNCDEFAMGSSSEHCAFATPRNPHDFDRVPGGSSGGSAAAVAAGCCPAALGSDTGGSIRQPAAFCGITGVKPSYGRVSRYGLVAFGSSLDQVGPLTNSVADAAGLLQVIAGPDRRDATSAEVPVPDYLAQLESPVKDLTVGVATQQLDQHNDPAVNAAVEGALEIFRGHGADVVEVDLTLTEHALSSYYVIAPAEASSNLARFDGIRYGRRADLEPGETLEDLYCRSRGEGFGPEVRRRIMLGTYVLSSGYYDAYYKRALQVRRLIRDEFARIFDRCHVLLGPTTPGPAFAVGEMTDPLQMYRCDLYTTGANIAGHCAVSLPAGWSGGAGPSLPVGIQLQCRPFDETTLLKVARLFETHSDFRQRPTGEAAK